MNEELKNRFSEFALQNGLHNDLKRLLDAEMAASGYSDDVRNGVHAFIDTAGAIALFATSAHPVGALVSSILISAGHRFNDWQQDSNRRQDLQWIESLRERVSTNLMKTLNNTVASQGFPTTTNEEYLKDTRDLINQINPYFMTQKEINNFENLSKQVNAKISDAQKSAILRKGNEIIQKIEEQGITLSEQAKVILMQNEEAQENVSFLVAQSILNEQREAENTAHQQREADFQAMLNASSFCAQLGRVAGCESLTKASLIAGSGIQIFKAMEDILSVNNVSLAILNPYAAIGMAALNIVSLFQKQKDPNEALMRMLTQLSEQLSDFRKEVAQRFSKVDDKLDKILDSIERTFKDLQRSSNRIERRLDDIQQEINVLHTIAKTQASDFHQQKLTESQFYVKRLINGSTSSTKVSQKDYNEHVSALSDFALYTSSASALNGNMYIENIDFNALTLSNICFLLKLLSKKDSDGILAILVSFAERNKLPIKSLSLLRSNGEKEVFHVALWKKAVEYYLYMRERFTALDKNYADNTQELKMLIEQARSMETFVVELQKNKNVFDWFMTRIKEKNQKISSMIQTDFIEKNKISPAGSSQQESIQVERENEGAILDVIKKRLVTKQEKKLIKETFSKKHREDHIHNLVVQKKIAFENEIIKAVQSQLPEKVKQALALGLGTLKITIHYPLDLQARTNKKDHKGLFKYAAGKSGIDAVLTLSGDTFELFKPIDVLGYEEKDKFSAKYSGVLITKLKQSCLSYNDVFSNKKDTLNAFQKKLNEKTMSLTKDKMDDMKKALEENGYYDLLLLNNMLLAYLRLAGLPENVLALAKNTLYLDDIIPRLEKYETKENNEHPLPVFPSSEAIDALKASIFSSMDSASELSASVLNMLDPLILRLEQFKMRFEASQQNEMAANDAPTSSMAHSVMFQTTRPHESTRVSRLNEDTYSSGPR